MSQVALKRTARYLYTLTGRAPPRALREAPMNKQMAALLLVVCLGVGSASSTDRPASAPPVSPARVTLTWLGNAGWEVSDGTTIILVDPYLSRIRGPAPPGAPP